MTQYIKLDHNEILKHTISIYSTNTGDGQRALVAIIGDQLYHIGDDRELTPAAIAYGLSSI